jgi:surfeit locus 1 family protein
MHLFKIKNWKLTILALIFIVIFARLGFWQLARSEEKKFLLKSFAERNAQSPLEARTISQGNDLRFYRTRLTGSFDNSKTILLDNKIYEGKIGYQVYTPFMVKDLTTPILVDRGFIPIGKSRKILPSIKAITGDVTIVGMLNLPPRYFSLGKMNDRSDKSWPLRIEYLNLSELSKYLNYPLQPYLLNINPNDPAAFEVRWQIVTMSPEKHLAYALQWFALALTLLILSVALNRNT